MKISNQIFFNVVDFVDEKRMKAFNGMIRNLSSFSTRRIAASCKTSVFSCQRRDCSSIFHGKFRFEKFFKNLLRSDQNSYFLRKPVIEAHQEEGENDSLRFSVTSMQGWRAQQEDAHNCILNFASGCSMFAVYDGHGGSEVAEYSSKNLPSYIKETGSLEKPDISAALKKCFAQFDQTLKQAEVVHVLNATRGEGSRWPGFESGATACVALLFENRIVVANVGDTRAVLCRDGCAIDLSIDHKPEDAVELNRIQKAGGTVTSSGRVNGGLNLSRAFGDHTYKNRKLEPEAQMISPVPDVVIAELVPEDALLVVACDGIWNCMSSQEIMDFINARIDSMSLSEIGQEITKIGMTSTSSQQVREEGYNSDENMEIDSSAQHTPEASSRYGGTNDESMFRSPTLSMSLRHRKRKLDYSGTDFDDEVSSTRSKRSAKSIKAEDDDYTPRKPRKNRLRTSANTSVRSSQQSTAVTRRSAPRDANNSGLFAVLRAGKNLDSAAEQWVTDYELDANKAILQILQLFVDSCGCSGVLNEQIFQIDTYGEVIEDLSGEFDEDTAEYPLGVSSTQWKKFRSNFAKFLLLFISKCRREIIYDTIMMDHVLKLLTAFSGSPVRAFRHTSTFAAMKLSFAIASIMPQLITLKEKTMIQIEAEKAKLNNAEESSGRLEILVATRSDLDQKMDDLKMMVDYTFKTIAAARYRDVVVDIRCICVEEMCNCMLIYPAAFMEDAYLKFIGWGLSDKSPDVRLKCVVGLSVLYDHGELIGHLEMFTRTFIDRLASLVNDHVPEVAVKAAFIVTQIYCTFPSLLRKEHCDPIYELIYSSNRSVALAVGRFLSAKILQDEQSNNSSMQTSFNEARQWFLNLVQFYREVKVQQKNTAFLVDALIDLNPILKNWSAMAEMLLQEDVNNGEESTILLELIACAVKEAATGEAPPGRTPIPKRTGSFLAQSTRTMKEDKKRISEAFIPVISRLVDRFMDDPHKLIQLTSIPMHFRLELYFATSRKLNSHLDDLMLTLARIAEQHADESLLQNVAKIISFFSKQDPDVANQSEPMRNEITEKLAIGVRQAMQNFESQSDDEQEHKDEAFERHLLIAYTKIVAFSTCVDDMCVDTDRYGLWDMTLKMANNEAGAFDCAELVEKGVIFLFRQLAWRLERITEVENADDHEIRDLVVKRDQFLACAKSILENSSFGVENAFSDDGIVDVLSNEFTEFRELSKRFSLSFGPDLIRNREAIVMIHKDGISYALNVEEQRRLRNKDKKPSDLIFLEALIDFVPRLVSQDKVVVLSYLEKHCPVKPEPSADDDTRDPFC